MLDPFRQNLQTDGDDVCKDHYSCQGFRKARMKSSNIL